MHAVLHFALDLVAQLLNFQLLRQVLVDLVQTHLDVGRLKHVLLVFGGQRGQRRRDEVHHAAGVVDVRRDGRELVRQSGGTSDDLLEQRQNIPLQRFDLGVLRRVDFGNRFHGGAHERIELRVFRYLHALQALGKYEKTLVRHPHNFVHHGEAADGIEVSRLRRVHSRLALGHHDDGFVVTQGVDQLNRTFPAYRQRQHGMREQDGVTHRQKRQRPRLVRIISELGVGCQLSRFARYLIVFV